MLYLWKNPFIIPETSSYVNVLPWIYFIFFIVGLLKRINFFLSDCLFNCSDTFLYGVFSKVSVIERSIIKLLNSTQQWGSLSSVVTSPLIGSIIWLNEVSNILEFLSNTFPVIILASGIDDSISWINNADIS